MIVKGSATRLVFAAGCLTAIVTLPTADAQMGAPSGYGYAPPARRLWLRPTARCLWLWPTARNLSPTRSVWPVARRLWRATKPLWQAARFPCAAEPIRPTAAPAPGNPADNQRSANQPG